VLVSEAANLGVELVIFPEMTLTGFSMNTKAIAEEFEGSASLDTFKELSRKYGIHIVFGLVLKHGDKAANTLVHLSPEGELLAKYVKIHPFTFAGEDKFFARGNELAIVKIGELTFGYSICYDLRFPELYSALASRCHVIVNIANWPKRRVHHWRSLLRARAIENQVFMIGVNRIGIDANGLEYEKSSEIFDANGESMVPIMNRSLELDVFEIDYGSLQDFKIAFNTFRDRRVDLYPTLV
jgi:predicted amidohydrolase